MESHESRWSHQSKLDRARQRELWVEAHEFRTEDARVNLHILGREVQAAGIGPLIRPYTCSHVDRKTTRQDRVQTFTVPTTWLQVCSLLLLGSSKITFPLQKKNPPLMSHCGLKCLISDLIDVF